MPYEDRDLICIIEGTGLDFQILFFDILLD